MELEGTIKWYNPEKGYGFIEVKKDYFVTKEQLEGIIPKEGEKIYFETDENSNKAIKVYLVVQKD